MSRHPSCTDLSVGVIAALAVLGGAAAILVFGRVGTIHGKKLTIYALAGEARGVIRGTEVWLEGQRVGTVNAISFRPVSTGQDERLVLALGISERVHEQIRLDSHAQIRAGGSLIGDQVVYLSIGSAQQRRVVDGDTLRAAEQPDMEETSSQVAIASREFPGIIENLKLITAQIQTTENALGAFAIERGGPEFRALELHGTRVMSHLSSSNGTIGLSLRGSGALQAQAALAMSRVDSIRALLSSNEHSLGRFRRDSTLRREVTAIRDDIANLERLAADPSGSVGRFRSDSAITRGIRRDRAALDSLLTDMKKHPFRYVAF